MKLIGKIVLWGVVVFVLLFVVIIFGPRDEASVAEQRCLEEEKIAGEWVPKHSAEYRMKCMEEVRKTYGKEARGE